MATATVNVYIPPAEVPRNPWPTCISPAEKAEAKTACERSQVEIKGLGLSDPLFSDPCRAASLPTCSGSTIGPPGTDDGSGSKGALVVAGLLGLLVVGGVAYVATRKKKQ